MNRIYILAITMILGGCSAEQFDEFVFRKVMEYQLKDECGEDNRPCIEAIEEQIESCMQKSDWRTYLDSDGDQEETQRFIRDFFPCFKDANGKSYFPVSANRQSSRQSQTRQA